MELKEATEEDIKKELYRREVEKKHQEIKSAVNEIAAAFLDNKIEAVKWEHFKGICPR